MFTRRSSNLNHLDVPVGVVALAGLLLTVMTGLALAASAPPDTTKPVLFLKEMLVTGSRYPRAFYESPQALSFLSRRQVREAVPNVTGDVLSMLPGVDNSKDSPWEQRPVVRGLGGQRVLVLMDGSPMNSARGNGPHPSLVDPSQIDRIEVVRGPSSVSYGSDALGGVINIITREALPSTGDRGLHGGVTVGGSSAEKLRSVVGDMSPRIGKFSAFLSGGGRKTEDYKSPDGTVSNSSFTDYNWLSNLRYDFTDRLALKAGWQQYRANNVGIPGLNIAQPGYKQAFDFGFYNRDYAHVTLDHQYPSSTWLDHTRVQVYWQREFRDFWSNERIDASAFPTYLPPGPTPAGAQTRVTNQERYFDLDTWGFQTQMTSAKTRTHRFTLGVDAARDQTNGDNVRFRWFQNAAGAPVSNPTVLRTASVPDGKFDNYAGFVQSEWYVHPRATISAGGRVSHYRYRTDAGINVSGFPFVAKSVDDNAVSGSVGITYTPRRDVHVTANVANGFREPNAQDLFFSGPASVGFVDGNPDLKPEKSISYDAGLRWGPGGFGLSGNVFYSTFNDLIIALPVSPMSPRAQASGLQSEYKYTNVATATMWGGDLEGQVRFMKQWMARAQFSGQVADITSRDAISRVYQVSADKVPLESVPPFKGSTSLRWNDGSGRYWVETTARWSWRTNRLPPPTPGVGQLTAFKKEYLVGDVMTGATLSGYRVALGVRNFTDRAYQPSLASVEDPGISVVGSLSTSF